MADKISPALAARIRQTPKPEPSADKLAQARDMVRQLRDLARQIEDADEAQKERKRGQEKLRHNDLPDLFAELRITDLGLEAEGNLPAYLAKLRPYYKANISTEWEAERQAAAFDWLEENGYGDIIRREFVVSVDRNDEKGIARVRAALDKLGVEYVERRTVPWASLTALIKEIYEKAARDPTGSVVLPPLETLGATVGRVVDIKPAKEKR